MAKLTEKEISHLASLSALSLSDEQVKKYANEFESILNFVDKISKTDTLSFDMFAREIEFDDLREDEQKQSLSTSEVLKNAPKKRKEFFNVPKVVE